MQKNKKNEELQSRREFFKKAAKGALPILGAVVLASAPGIVSAASKSMGCNGSCYLYCDGGCKGTCTTVCGSSCMGGCKSNCKGSCYTGCYGNNYGNHGNP